MRLHRVESSRALVSDGYGVLGALEARSDAADVLGRTTRRNLETVSGLRTS